MNIEPAIFDFKNCDLPNYCEFLIPDFKQKYGIEYPTQVKYLFQYFKEFSCTHVYKESFYYSNSFIYDYASFHVYRSSAETKYCSRFIYLDLKNVEINGVEDFKRKFIFIVNGLTDAHVLGLNIIKPTYVLNHKFGISYLKPYSSVGTNYKRYYNSLIERTVNVLGKVIKLKSSILNGQDELGLCSTSALYSLTNWLAKTLDTKNYHPGELTKFIGKNFSNNGFRTLPSTGLSTGQIMVFLQHLKLTFDKFEIKQSISPPPNVNDFLINIQDNILFIKEIVRAYNFSCGFPVLLGLNRKFKDLRKIGGLHNSVCVGFREKEQESYRNGSLAQNIDRLYVCDDNIGSQTSVNFLDPGNYNIDNLKKINKNVDFDYLSTDGKSYLNKEQNSEEIEEPFYVQNALRILKDDILKSDTNDVSNKFETFQLFSIVDEEVICIDCLDYLLIPIPRTITVSVTTIKDIFLKVNEIYVSDTVLYKSNDLKNYYLSLSSDFLSESQKSKFIELLLHKYVWRVSIMDIIDEGKKIQPIVDFIFDSNEQKESPNFLSACVVFNELKYNYLIKNDDSELKKIVSKNSEKVIVM